MSIFNNYGDKYTCYAKSTIIKYRSEFLLNYNSSNKLNYNYKGFLSHRNLMHSINFS